MNKNRRDEDARTILIARLGMFGAQAYDHKDKSDQRARSTADQHVEIIPIRHGAPKVSANLR
jgi:hypothetical protein